MTKMPRQRSTGNAGVYEVMGEFSRIGWGPASNSDSDSGTDIWVQPTDETLNLLRCQLGVQVKSGSSYFKRLGEKNGEAGWWYDESSSDRFDDWAYHQVRHLIVLRDLDARVSYWEHVTPAAVVSTGQGRKIFVPAHQIIDEEHAAELRRIALSPPPVLSFEGTVLGPRPDTILPESELRYALIAPRLIASPLDFDPDKPIGAVEGVALLVQGRFREFSVIAGRHEEVPDPREPDDGADWAWRFVSAIWDWAFNDAVEPLRSVVETSPDPARTAASGVFATCALARAERHPESISLLTPLVEDDQMDPIDRAWVLVQRARASSEIGDLSQCNADAVAARDLLEGLPDEITKSAVAAAAEWLMAISGGDESHDYRQVAVASDTHASWWQSQRAAWGLATAVDVGFRAWAQEMSVTLGGNPDHGEADLFGTELCADLAGVHSAWNHFASLGARLRIQHAGESSEQHDEFVEGLDALRRSGDDKSLRLAFRRLLWDGPIDSVASAVARIQPHSWTRTAIATNFAALEISGELLSEDAAAETLDWMMNLVEDGLAEFIDSFQPTMNVSLGAYEAIAGVMPASSAASHSDVARFIATRPTDHPGLYEERIANLLDWLDAGSVDTADRAALRQRAFQTQSVLSTRILGWLGANDDTEAFERLKSQASQGDLEALAELSDVQLLDPSEAEGLIAVLEGRTQRALSEMRDGRHSSGSVNAFDALTLLNLQFPDAARWHVVHDLLREPAALADQKRTICTRIASLTDRLPTAERERLIDNLDDIATATEGFWSRSHMAGADIVLAVAIDAITPNEAEAAVTRLALGSDQQRVNAAKLLGFGHCPAMQSMLAQMIRDPHPSVRSQAARSIGKIAARTPNPLTETLTAHMTESDGRLLPFALLAGLAHDSPPLNHIGEAAAIQLQDHRSAHIRRQSRLLLESQT